MKVLLLLLAALPGCALDLNGTGLLPADPPEADAADGAADTFKPREAAAPIVVDAAPPIEEPPPPPGPIADPVAFKACLTTCTHGCCDPTGACLPGTADNACGAASACVDCTPYQSFCVAGTCSGQYPGMECQPPFMVNPHADAGQPCIL